MTTVTTCCTPCAAAVVAPQPVIAAAAPTVAVTGGGAPGTAYSPEQAPAPTGQYVPAPTAGGDTPPEPIALAPSPTAPAALPSTPAPISATASTATTEAASTRANWPTWQAEFSRLGVSAEDIARIGALPLSNAQLAGVYEQVFLGVQQQGAGTTTTSSSPVDQTGAPSKAGGWDASWDAKFLALGMPKDQVAELAARAKSTGATTKDIEGVYQQAVQQVGGTPNTPGQTDPGQGPGWSPEWEAKFTQLGMPADIVGVYASSGATAAGLEAAFNTATEKRDDFQARGWLDKFTKAGVPPSEMWNAILVEPKLEDKQLQAIVDAAKTGHMNGWQRALQAGVTFFPGGELVQYALGRKVVSGKEIDRGNLMNIGFAALSGLALFTSIKGVSNLARGFKAIGGGMSELTKTGIATQGLQVAQDTALGATRNWGFKEKLLSTIPGTRMHRLVVGAGHVEAAAGAFNGGGLAKILKQDDGAFLANQLGSMFDDIKTGRTLVRGSSNAYAGMLTKGSALPMTLGVTKDGQQVVNVARGLRIGDGRSQLAALAGVAGQRLGGASDLAPSKASTLASIMAGNVARATGVGNDGVLATLALKRAAAPGAVNPSWYLDLAAKTAAGGGAAEQSAAAAATSGASSFVKAAPSTPMPARVQLPPEAAPSPDLAKVKWPANHTRAASPAPTPTPAAAPAPAPAAAAPAAAPAPAAAAPTFDVVSDAAGRPMIKFANGKSLYIARDVPTGTGTIDPEALAAFSRHIATGG